jgi:beta-galactosidase
LILSSLGKTQTAILNGKTLYQDAAPDKSAIELAINGKSLLAKGNHLRIVAQPYDDWGMRENIAKLIPVAVRSLTPAAAYERRVFNGLAQVIVQAGTKPGAMQLSARSQGLTEATSTVALLPAHK